jgi:hypothetical protein
MTLSKESQKFQCFVLSSSPPRPLPKKEKERKRKVSVAELAIIPKDN